jgi:hypothetical protein
MRSKILLGILAAIVVLGIGTASVSAATETVTTTLYFNIAAVDELTVTLLGQAAVTSAPTGTATPANIEFNSTTGTDAWLNATVTGGGATQDGSNAILVLDNTGTTNLNINISTAGGLAACQALRYNTTWCATPSTCATDLDTTEITLDSSFTPAETAINLWLWGNFSACTDADDASTTLTMEATTV